jgi:hypothetical protein
MSAYKQSRSRILIYLAFLVLGLIIGYFSRKPITIAPVKEKEVVKQELPKCFLGRCPEYFSMDVDGDDLAESLVIIPTAMTQGAGKLWVIDEGKVIFETNEMMRIWVKQSPEDAEAGNRFTLLYAKEVNSNDLTEVKYVYQDGQFKKEEE